MPQLLFYKGEQHQEPDEAVLSLEVLDELKQVSKALQELLDEE